MAREMLTHVTALLVGLGLATGVAQLRIDALTARHAAAAANAASVAAHSAIAAADVAAREQQQMTAHYEKALNESLKNQSTLRADAAGARAAADRLRKQTAAAAERLALPDTPAAAGIEYATATGELLASCAAAYQELAAVADGHVSTIRLMQDAWPTVR